LILYAAGYRHQAIIRRSGQEEAHSTMAAPPAAPKVLEFLRVVGKLKVRVMVVTSLSERALPLTPLLKFDYPLYRP
jgi:hypothetical protein